MNAHIRSYGPPRRGFIDGQESSRVLPPCAIFGKVSPQPASASTVLNGGRRAFLRTESLFQMALQAVDEFAWAVRRTRFGWRSVGLRQKERGVAPGTGTARRHLPEIIQVENHLFCHLCNGFGSDPCSSSGYAGHPLGLFQGFSRSVILRHFCGL